MMMTIATSDNGIVRPRRRLTKPGRSQTFAAPLNQPHTQSRAAHQGCQVGTGLSCMLRHAWDDKPLRCRFPALRGRVEAHCGHERAVNMDEWPDDAAVPSFTRACAVAAVD